VTVIEMPKLSDSMEGGLIVTWLKNDADLVSEGEDLLEIETDKATIVYAAEVSGTLEICVPAGKTVDVGTVIAEVHVGNAAPVTPREATPPTASTNGEAAQGEAEIAARAAPASANPNVESEVVVSVDHPAGVGASARTRPSVLSAAQSGTGTSASNRSQLSWSSAGVRGPARTACALRRGHRTRPGRSGGRLTMNPRVSYASGQSTWSVLSKKRSCGRKPQLTVSGAIMSISAVCARKTAPSSPRSNR